MVRRVRRVAVATKSGDRLVEAAAHDVIVRLLKHHLQVVSIPPLKHRTVRSASSIQSLSADDVDVLITVGGDGTLLKSVRSLSEPIPVVGVNAGVRGVLLEVVKTALDASIERLINGDYFVEKRIRILARIGSRVLPPALNELFISRVQPTRTPWFNISAPPRIRLKQRMDGLIISTPTGSTGHSFSLGGPVLFEGLDALLLTPICPISRMPPIVLSLGSITVSSDRDLVLVVDGQEEFHAKPSETIRVSRHPKDALLVRFERQGLRQLANLGFA